MYMRTGVLHDVYAMSCSPKIALLLILRSGRLRPPVIILPSPFLLNYMCLCQKQWSSSGQKCSFAWTHAESSVFFSSTAA